MATPAEKPASRNSVGRVSSQSISKVREDDQAKAYETLVSAFTDDPVERWLYPDTSDYLAHFPVFLKAFGGRAFDAQCVWTLAEFGAVAMWLPPGTEPDGDAILATMMTTVDVTKHDDMLAVLEQMDAAHPTHAHWYLPWFGVEATQQGQGLGAQLLSHCLVAVDESHLPAYLESPNPRNVSFYERHGFEVTGQAQSGACPPIVFMSRSAR
jgi:ribosomal protein S18 acetylase RimI-like enzyme